MKTDFTWHDIMITALKVHDIIITGLNGPGITITVFNWHDIMHACLNEYSVTISGLNSNGIMIKWKKYPIRIYYEIRPKLAWNYYHLHKWHSDCSESLI